MVNADLRSGISRSVCVCVGGGGGGDTPLIDRRGSQGRISPCNGTMFGLKGLNPKTSKLIEKSQIIVTNMFLYVMLF